VWASELADNAVDTAAIQHNAVTTSKIANWAVTSSKIKDGTISEDKLTPSVRNKLNQSVSKSDILAMWFKDFISSCNADNVGKRRRSDFKKCVFLPSKVVNVYPRKYIDGYRTNVKTAVCGAVCWWRPVIRYKYRDSGWKYGPRNMRCWTNGSRGDCQWDGFHGWYSNPVTCVCGSAYLFR